MRGRQAVMTRTIAPWGSQGNRGASPMILDKERHSSASINTYKGHQGQVHGLYVSSAEGDQGVPDYRVPAVAVPDGQAAQEAGSRRGAYSGGLRGYGLGAGYQADNPHSRAPRTTRTPTTTRLNVGSLGITSLAAGYLPLGSTPFRSRSATCFLKTSVT